MRVGETSIFEFSSDYGYGDEGAPGRGAPDIPGGASIVFEIELMGCEVPELTYSDRRKLEEKSNLSEIRFLHY
jgi:FKBP-type peptidyl-prolyl cis-trans isomerase